MVNSRPTNRSAIPAVSRAVCSVMLVMTIVTVWPNSLGCLFAEEAEKAIAKTDDLDPDFVVPDGTPEEILQFVDKLKNRDVKFANRKERIEYIINFHKAMISAGDKILNQDVEDKVAVNAAQLKLMSLTVLATNDVGDYAKDALAVALKLKSDPRRGVSKVVERFWSQIRMSNLTSMTADERKEFSNDLIVDVSNSKFSRQAVTAASQLGDVLADKGFTEEAGDVLDRLAKLAKESEDSNVVQAADRFEAMARRLRLPGNFMAIEGKALSGEFDWASYRGKVVLVDFWATWCGPCIAELPNVKKNYARFQDKGFEVVGISLDQSREALEKFIQKEEIPWTQLYDEEIQKDEGWNHPMARHFGINAIPAAILVDKDGKVVSLAARGEDLTKLLEKLLGKSE